MGRRSCCVSEAADDERERMMMVTVLGADIARKAALLSRSAEVWAGPLSEAVGRSHGDLERRSYVQGLWAKRAELWSDDPDARRRIRDRLGWLESPEAMAATLPRVIRFADGIRSEDIRHVVLLGMGGSSLASEVMRAILGVAAGAPQFTTLDSTDPAAIRAVEKKIPIQETLFLVSSKSGATIEPNLLAAYFVGRLEAAGIRQAARHLIAITDEGTALHQLAQRQGYREVFLNPSDIGGRYSALSFFGLVPAALMGIDVASLLAWSRAMAGLCGPAGAAADNPGVALGVIMGAGALNGRDKLTLITAERLTPFGLWIEQLVAESTGKGGTGIVPIAGETIGPPSAYGEDRLFVRLRLHGDNSEEEQLDRKVASLRAAGFPLVTIELEEPTAIGAEFVRWEIATATAGAILGINPFDEPNVQQAKDATHALLERFAAKGRLPVLAPEITVGDLRLTFGKPVLDRIGVEGTDAGVMLGDFFQLLSKGDYIALLAYLPYDASIGERYARLRVAIRDRFRVATMFGYGPRYLHSTGQLHKGGPNTGAFVIFTADPAEDVAIPGRPYTFGALELAQALGDFSSLEATGRRVARIHLRAPRLENVDRACAVLEGAIPSTWTDCRRGPMETR